MKINVHFKVGNKLIACNYSNSESWQTIERETETTHYIKKDKLNVTFIIMDLWILCHIVHNIIYMPHFTHFICRNLKKKRERDREKDISISVGICDTGLDSLYLEKRCL